MKLQFAFGNPRKGKKKAKKKVAHKAKKAKTKSALKNLKKVSLMAKKAKKKVVRKASKKKSSAKRKISAKKNPAWFVAYKKGKKIGHGRKVLTPKESQELKTKHRRLNSEYAFEKDPAKKLKIKAELFDIVKKMRGEATKARQEMRTAKRFMEEGADLKFYSTEKGEKEDSMAKKKATKKAGKKAAKKASKKAAKKSHKKAASKKAHKKAASKKAHKKAASKKAHKAAPVATPKKSHKRKKRAKRITHSHSSLTRHLKKGTRLKVKASAGKGKKKVSLAGFLKVNPRGMAMKNIKKYAGMDVMELGAIALGGALVPVINSGLTKIPGVDTVVAKINSLVGPQAAGSVLPILAGVAVNAASEHVLKGAKAKEISSMVGEGLVAAGVIGLAMSLSQKYVAPALGLSGVNYTPMSGINYSPMSGINYSPMHGMGVVPQLAGPDFGAVDYGSGGYSEDRRFSKSDFGGMSMDASADDQITEDDIEDDGMLGGLG